jgi:hypothetical protein
LSEEHTSISADQIAEGQSVSGEVLPPSTTENGFPNSSVSGVLQGFADDGGRSLGNMGASRIVAATVANQEQEISSLKSELKIERKSRVEAEKMLARNEGAKSNEPMRLIAGSFLTIIGAALFGLGYQSSFTTAVDKQIYQMAFGAIVVIVGLFTIHLGRGEKK